MKPAYTSLPISELIREVTRNYRYVLGIPFAAAIVAAIITLTMDNEFKSTANLMPAQQRSIGIEALLGGRVGSLAGSLLGGGRTTVFDRYQVLLTSETVQRAIIDEFDLINIYEKQDAKFPYMETMKTLRGKTRFRGSVEGNFLIEVWDTDPERAKSMAEAYIRHLNEFNNSIANKEAREFREFIEKRYTQAFADVDSLRMRLAEFQRQTKIYELPEQLSQYFSLLANIMTQRMEAEARMDVIARTSGTANTRYQQAQIEVDVLQRKIDEILRSSGKDELLFNVDDLPEMSMEYFELLQMIELQTEILKFVVPVYEQAKLEEAKNLSTASVIDMPRVAERKDRPGRSIIVLATGASAFLMMVFFVILWRIYVTNREFYRYFVQ
jgi:capsule polysaccharide export protein KpsE/RkpR